MREREQSQKCKDDLGADLADRRMVVDTGFLGRTYEAFVSNRATDIRPGSWSEIGEFLGTIDSKTKGGFGCSRRIIGSRATAGCQGGGRRLRGHCDHLSMPELPNRLLLRVRRRRVTVLRMETVVYATAARGSPSEGSQRPCRRRVVARSGATSRMPLIWRRRPSLRFIRSERSWRSRCPRAFEGAQRGRHGRGTACEDDVAY